MNDHDDPDAERPGSAPKHPYQRPSVLESAQFETLALQCGKNDTEVFGCFESPPPSAS